MFFFQDSCKCKLLIAGLLVSKLVAIVFSLYCCKVNIKGITWKSSLCIQIFIILCNQTRFVFRCYIFYIIVGHIEHP